MRELRMVALSENRSLAIRARATTPAMIARMRWSLRPTGLSLRSIGWLGFAGCSTMAASSYWVGAVPLYFRMSGAPVRAVFPVGALIPRIAFYLGLIALFIAWGAMGQRVLGVESSPDWRMLRRIGLAWSAPMVVSVPLASRDLWAYAAQSQLVLHHLDPYNLGPSALPGAFSVEVSHRWIDTPAPYGPLWLYTGRGIAAAVGGHVGLTVAALRVLAVLGLILVAFSLPTLARRAGGEPGRAIWLVVANPITVILGIGGGHNDMLMIGLMSVGLVIVTRPSWSIRNLLLGTVLLTMAVAIKSPAAVPLAFAVPIWFAGRRTAPGHQLSIRGAVGTTATVLFTAVGLFTMITWLSGLGLGWVKQVNSAASVVSWMSLPSGAAIVWDLLHGELHRSLKLDPQMTYFRTVGTVISITVLAAFWAAAMRANAMPKFSSRFPRLRVVDPWKLLAISLTTVVVLGPSVQPWYFLWAASIAAATPLRHSIMVIIAGLSVGMVAMIRPNGVGLQMNPIVVIILGCAIWWAHRALRPSIADAAGISSKANPRPPAALELEARYLPRGKWTLPTSLTGIHKKPSALDRSNVG
jgi:alpha-1,6-mannosyltransferase